jgi:hypothetical protein
MYLLDDRPVFSGRCLLCGWQVSVRRQLFEADIAATATAAGGGAGCEFWLAA